MARIVKPNIIFRKRRRHEMEDLSITYKILEVNNEVFSSDACYEENFDVYYFFL